MKSSMLYSGLKAAGNQSVKEKIYKYDRRDQMLKMGHIVAKICTRKNKKF